MAFRTIPARRIGVGKRKKSKNSREVLRRLQEYIDGNCDGPVKILCGFWEDQQDAISYQELRQAVMDGSLSTETARLWTQDYSLLVKNQLKGMWTDALTAGPSGQPLLDGKDFQLDMQDSGILNWISERGAEFVTSCTQDQKDAIAALLTKKMRDGHTVDELARMIRPCIGLTEGQAAANAKYYDNIVETLTKEHPRMSKESIRKKALDASTKYAERQHRQRAMTIAQTESAFAYNRGADEGVRQAQEHGLLGECKKRWSTSGDDGVCSICAALEGVEVEMNDDFEFKGKLLFAGQHMLPPAHPRCACAVEYIEVSPPVQNGADAESMAGSTDYLVRDHAPGLDTSGERAVVDDAVSSVPDKVREALNRGTVIDVGKNGACQYDYVNDILYVAKGADKAAVIHEIGHMVENKMMDAGKVSELRKQIADRIFPTEIETRTMYDATGNGHIVFIAMSDEFVSDYQGRLYVNDWDEIYDENWKIHDDRLLEFVSESFREYIQNPGRLKKRFPELYTLIKEAVE